LIGSSTGSESPSGSSSKGNTASSYEADSAEDTIVPPCSEPPKDATEPNRWYVDGQYQIYKDARMLNENDKMSRLITE